MDWGSSSGLGDSGGGEVPTHPGPRQTMAGDSSEGGGKFRQKRASRTIYGLGEIQDLPAFIDWGKSTDL